VNGGDFLPLVLAGIVESTADNPLAALLLIGLMLTPVSSALVLIFLSVESL